MTTDTLFKEIAQFVEESRNLLRQGAMMELAGLDSRVRELCEQVLQLTQEERIRYNDRLQYLLGELKALGEELVAKRDMVGEEIRSATDHKKASNAYRTVHGSDPEDDDEVN